MIHEVLSYVATSCSDGGSFLGFPTWYKYLDGVTINNVCSPKVTALSDVWLIVAAVIEILLRIAVLAAVFVIVYGGFSYTTSQGEPDKTAKARSTIINGAGGLVIAIMATAAVSFIAGSVK